MKKIKFQDKLSFNKEVVSKLNDHQMNGLRGGGFTSIGKKCTHVAGGCGGDGPKITKGPGCKDLKDTGPICTVSLACEDIETVTDAPITTMP